MSASVAVREHRPREPRAPLAEGRLHRSLAAVEARYLRDLHAAAPRAQGRRRRPGIARCRW
jgi:hypothetical protein